jgi:hypothetical protein
MSESRDFDRMARAWLDLMPDTAPDRAVAAVLEAVETTPQLRSSPFGGSRRSSTVTRLALVAATLLIAAVGAYALVGGRPQQPDTPPSITPTTPPAAVDGPLDDVLRANWLSIANENPVLENGSGPVTLSIGPSGADIIAANFGPGLDYPSTTTQLGLDELEVVLTRDSRDCGAGDRGVYRWALSADRSRLTLTALSDTCTKRAVVFGRVWVRSLVGPTTVGAGVVDVLDPDFAITLPDDAYATRTLDDFVEIASSDGVGLLVFKNPQPFADACSTAEERITYQPGADAFIEAFRANDAFEVGEAEELTIDGHRAVHVQIGGKPNVARCPGQDLYLYTPRLCQCHFVVGQGAADSDYLVEVGEDTFLFVVSPIDSPNEREIIESLRIPFDLPVQ